MNPIKHLGSTYAMWVTYQTVSVRITLKFMVFTKRDEEPVSPKLPTYVNSEDRITLIRLLERDQTLRGLLGKLEYKKIDSLIHENDISSMKYILTLIKKIGFPDKSKVGIEKIG